MSVVRVTRRRDPLEGQQLSVLLRWRRKRGGVDLLVVLPNDSGGQSRALS